jgi:hypothetical protein
VVMEGEGSGGSCERKPRAHNNRAAAYLLAKSLLSNHLADALSQLGISCDER